MIATLLLLGGPLGALQAAADDETSPYENADAGFRVKVPSGWTLDATRRRNVILTVTAPGDEKIRPQLQIYQIRLGQPVTISQYKEQVRHLLQRAFVDPRMLDDRDVEAGGRPAFVLVLASVLDKSVVVSHKGVVELNPMRMLGIDGIFPHDRAGELAATYNRFLESLETFPPRAPIGIEDRLETFRKGFAGATAAADIGHRKDDLEIIAGEKRIGEYLLELTPAERGGTPGMEIKSVYKIEVDGPQRVESHVSGFLSDDLKTQSVNVREVRVGTDKRTQNFEASVALTDGKVTAVRRINGEGSTHSFELRTDRVVLSDLIRALQARVAGAMKGSVAVPTVSAFDSQLSYSRFELKGKSRVQDEGESFDVLVTQVTGADGTIQYTWHDPNGGLRRITHSGRALVFKRKN